MQNDELARLLGYLPDGTPIWQQVGFAPDDEDEGGEDDEGQDDADTDDEDDEDEWTPPSREEWEQTQARLRRANKEAAKRRKLLKSKASDDDEVDDEENDDTGKPTDRRELKRLLARAEARAEAKYKPALVKQAAKTALVEAGFAGEVTSRTMRMLDLDDLVVDEDGEIVGLDEAIEELKEDMPQLFKRSSRSGSGSGRAASTKTTGRRSLDGGNKKAAKKDPSFAEQLAARIAQ